MVANPKATKTYLILARSTRKSDKRHKKHKSQATN